MVETGKKALVPAAPVGALVRKATPAKGLVRLAVAVSAANAALWLFCGTSEAARWLPTTENPYCDITTYKLRDLAEEAVSTMDRNGRPVIAVNANTLKDQPEYGLFLMAHECCHHSLGHVRRYREGFGHVGPQPFFYIAPALKQMELDADCCAVKMLKSKHESSGITAARQTMIGFGTEATGAYYPTGIERVDNIDKCAAQD